MKTDALCSLVTSLAQQVGAPEVLRYYTLFLSRVMLGRTVRLTEKQQVAILEYLV
jgi:hypothetical protein